jgi:hypothetical protein
MLGQNHKQEGRKQAFNIQETILCNTLTMLNLCDNMKNQCICAIKNKIKMHMQPI